MMKIRNGVMGLFLLVMGCDLFRSEAPEPFVPPKGMKIADLQPALPAENVLPIEFQIFAYELPIAKLPDFRDLLQTLDRTTAEVRDPAGFANNSLGVGFGKPQIGIDTVGRLESIGGEQIWSRALIVFDDKGDDLNSAELPRKAVLFWRDGSGADRSLEVGPGRLSWILKSKPSSGIRGLAEVAIQPGFRKKSDEIGGRMMGRMDIPIREFPVAAFSARMGPGEFLLFGPIQTPGDEKSLSGLLGRSPRNRREKVLIYLVICTRVSD